MLYYLPALWLCLICRHEWEQTTDNDPERCPWCESRSLRLLREEREVR